LATGKISTNSKNPDRPGFCFIFSGINYENLRN
jgi:hypothetical protein